MKDFSKQHHKTYGTLTHQKLFRKKLVLFIKQVSCSICIKYWHYTLCWTFIINIQSLHWQYFVKCHSFNWNHLHKFGPVYGHCGYRGYQRQEMCSRLIQFHLKMYQYNSFYLFLKIWRRGCGPISANTTSNTAVIWGSSAHTRREITTV